MLELNTTLNARRRYLVETIVNNSGITNLADLVYLELKGYERTLQDAFEGGLETTTDGERFRSLEELEKWTILQAVFFSSTVLTTIGKSGCFLI